MLLVKILKENFHPGDSWIAPTEGISFQLRIIPP